MCTVIAVADAALVPVVGRELERQQRLLLHGAARVVPERQRQWKNSACLSASSGFSLRHRRPRQRRGVVAEVTAEAPVAATSGSATLRDKSTKPSGSDVDRGRRA